MSQRSAFGEAKAPRICGTPIFFKDFFLKKESLVSMSQIN
jgi:hypothetical protein